MKLMQKISFAAVLVGAVLANAALADLAIIGHPGINLRGVTNDDLAKVFLGKSKDLGGVDVKPIDQDEGSAARTKFYTDVVGKSEAQLKRHWSQLVFTGKGKPPPSVADDQAVKDWVASTPGAIGYIDGGSVDASVKVLSIIP